MFVSPDPRSHADLRHATIAMTEAIIRALSEPGPRSPLDPTALAAAVANIDPLPEDGAALDAVLHDLAPVLEGGIRLGDPNCVAHLHPAPLIEAAVAELAIGVTNQSMDAFDASPAATFVEDALVTRLAQLHGFPQGSGVMTMGGTASNLLGLLLARDRAGEDVRRRGLPPNRWRIAASATSHDSVRRSAALLGLGTEAVIGVPTDPDGRMSVEALHERTAGEEVIAIVGTAGTTDLGAIDPLDALADHAQRLGAWFHVDAAVGSGLMLSDTHRRRLDGIERANSITADLHKLWWMPFGASALLVPDVGALRAVHHASVYLNRPEDEAEGQLNLVGRSLDTSRRFDAFKVLVALRTRGRRQLGAMVDTVLDLTQYAGGAIERHPELELVAPPHTVMVAFRRLGDDARNIAIHRSLFATGEAVIGRTTVDGRVALKLTLLNPDTTRAQIDALLDLISAAATPAA
ncbi:pyridoxal phosphate-dependent decarboxylase family protein [Solirubrobacter deserti]|uniref:Pyridoxal-dependent decarboxylase n=1 Tax=Solirubrobacter deserti TaxID=2282478 RepID=A0ABT4RNR0_9ACTN|nr:pyridoxal-dependent decarboxylase [Solirubrobacter deserti]MDA0140217.1 pyridoxal-dependent decarboxylase [Solirubrobacter deserti]